MRYAVVFETGSHSISAYVPDLPGCIAAGKTLEEVKDLIAEAISDHIDRLREAGLPVPVPSSRCEYIEV
jgi:predicted RNase H-like HicB family nuclease